MFSSQPVSGDEEELRRLVYVALTRAEKHLYISYAKFKNDGKEMEPSMFIAEILEQHQFLLKKLASVSEKKCLNLKYYNLMHRRRKLKRLKKILLHAYPG